MQFAACRISNNLAELMYMAEGGDSFEQDESVIGKIKSWWRGGREADLTNVPVEKLQKAAERGWEVNITESKKGLLRGILNKKVIKGDKD